MKVKVTYTPEQESAAQAALDAAYAKLGQDATVLAMPYGGSTLPVVQP